MRRVDAKAGESVSIQASGEGNLAMTYLVQVRQRIEANFSHPFSNTGRRATVEFTIQRDGTISRDFKIIQSAGPSMDHYAIQALERTKDLPPLYDSYTKPFLRCQITFEFNQKN
ncbi:MAG: Gram-negative bacterial tonB protein [candidate division BRC1 bacterium ADurb.BinA292]|nr:MAG: Gram-negative bacterial tonB protein [candidate division BRC1 bacterium ADurb.BinA292]